MEVTSAGPLTLSEPPRRGTPLPLSQLVEPNRSRASVPNPLESKIYAKIQSNGIIHADPPELHFSGFELGEDYTKTLKLINVSSEAMNIHILPTQTKYFQTTYTKKYRLIPGLAYTLKVRLCPDEWRYFYDSIRVHCKGEENLLIPVHAYPVIDDLHIPPHIDLSAVPLGQSVCHAIPLRCSCPVNFEFQVCVIQPHEAFSIHPLTGVIPANGEEKITVTFAPVQYETCQVTIQLIISQFNTRPFLCTITGSSAPHLASSERRGKPSHGDVVPAELKGASSSTKVPKPKYRSSKDADKSKTLRDKGSVKPPVDVCSPAGVAKMLIKDMEKLSSKDLREAIACGSTAGVHSRLMKEALFMKKVQHNLRAEQANRLRWKVHLGNDPMSELTRRQIAEEREMALHEYMVKNGDVPQDEDFAAGQPKLSSRRVQCEAGQAPEGAPTFQFYSSFQWESRRKALRRFQQAARKVVIRNRLTRRLTALKSSDGLSDLVPAQKAEEETTCEPIFPFTFPVFLSGDTPLTDGDLVTLPVDPIDVTVTARIPFFKLQVPQHYKLMGYQPVSAWEAFTSYIPTALARPLRTGAQNVLVPGEVEARACEEQQHQEDPEEGMEAPRLSFTAPEGLLSPVPADLLRIFNPAPGLQAYKPTPKYLESDLEFQLCPIPRYTIPESKTSHSHKALDHHDVITGILMWKSFALTSFKRLSSQASLSSDCALQRSVDYSTDILPLTPPPPLTSPTDEPPPLMDPTFEDSGVHLTTGIIRAQFLSAEDLVANSNLTRATAARTARHQRELQMEATYRSECNQMGRRVTTRLRQLTDGESPGETHTP